MSDDLERIKNEATEIRFRLGKSSGVITATDGAVIADLIERMARVVETRARIHRDKTANEP